MEPLQQVGAWLASMWPNSWHSFGLPMGPCLAEPASEQRCQLLVWAVKMDQAQEPSACCAMPVLRSHAKLFVLPHREQCYLSDPESVQHLWLQRPEGALQISVASKVLACVLHRLMQHMQYHLVFLHPCCSPKCSAPSISAHGLTSLACSTSCSAHCHGWAARTIH